MSVTRLDELDGFHAVVVDGAGTRVAVVRFVLSALPAGQFIVDDAVAGERVAVVKEFATASIGLDEGGQFSGAGIHDDDFCEEERKKTLVQGEVTL